MAGLFAGEFEIQWACVDPKFQDFIKGNNCSNPALKPPEFSKISPLRRNFPPGSSSPFPSSFPSVTPSSVSVQPVQSLPSSTSSQAALEQSQPSQPSLSSDTGHITLLGVPTLAIVKDALFQHIPSLSSSSTSSTSSTSPIESETMSPRIGRRQSQARRVTSQLDVLNGASPAVKTLQKKK